MAVNGRLCFNYVIIPFIVSYIHVMTKTCSTTSRYHFQIMPVHVTDAWKLRTTQPCSFQRSTAWNLSCLNVQKANKHDLFVHVLCWLKFVRVGKIVDKEKNRYEWSSIWQKRIRALLWCASCPAVSGEAHSAGRPACTMSPGLQDSHPGWARKGNAVFQGRLTDPN